MKVVICGDSHIGAIYGLGGQNSYGGNTRIDDYTNTLNHIIDYAISNKVDAFIQTGDLFDKRTPSYEHLEIANNAIKRLSDANIFTAVIMGNHDYKRIGGAQSHTSSILNLPAKDYPNVRLLIEPDVITLSSGTEQLNLFLFPFRDRKMYAKKNTEEDSLEYEQEIKNLLAKTHKGSNIFIGHNFFYEGSYSAYSGAEVLINKDVFSSFDMACMGHIHEARLIKESAPIVFYTGSMDRLNFGDAKVNKFFFCYDSKLKTLDKIVAPVRDLEDLYFDFSSEDEPKINAAKAINSLNLKDKICRVKISTKEGATKNLKKIDLEKMLYAAGAFYVSNVTIETLYKKINRDVSILEEKEPLKIFQGFVNNQVIDKSLREKILIEAKNIIDGAI